MILYFIKCTIAMGASWFVYRIFLAEQKNFLLNRIYLLFSIVGSSVAPLIALPSLFQKKSIIKSASSVVNLSNPTLPGVVDPDIEKFSFSLNQYVSWIILSISLILIIRFLYQIASIVALYKTPYTESIEEIKIAIIEDSRTPFSFLDTMFVSQETYTSGIPMPVFQHEKYHIQKLHSIDRIIIETLVSILWMNPFIYLLKQDLIDNHEFGADAYAINQTKDSKNYLSLLLRVREVRKSPNVLPQQFSQSSSLKRITMITKTKRNRQAWAYPFAFVLLIACFVSCTDDLDYDLISNTQLEENTKNIQVEGLSELFEKVRNKELPAPPMPPPKFNQPPQRLFEKWINQEKFEIWIDKEKVNNQELAKKHAKEFSHFTVRGTPENKKAENTYEFKVHLMTNRYYNGMIVQREELKKVYQEKYPQIWEKFEYLFSKKEIN